MKTKFLAFLCALVLLIGAVPAAGALAGESDRAADTLATLGLVQGTASGDYALNAPATSTLCGSLPQIAPPPIGISGP